MAWLIGDHHNFMVAFAEEADQIILGKQVPNDIRSGTERADPLLVKLNAVNLPLVVSDIRAFPPH
jgi:hypothetical protein